MLKTLNTITSLIAHEGVTTAVTRSIQTMGNAFESRLGGIRDDFARMLDNHESQHRNEKYNADNWRKTIEDSVVRALDHVDRVRQTTFNDLSANTSRIGAVADKIATLVEHFGQLTARFDSLETQATASGESDAFNASLNAFGRRLVALEDRVPAPSDVQVRFDAIEAAVATLQAKVADDTKGFVAVLKRLSAMEDAVYTPSDSTVVTPADLADLRKTMHELAERITKIEARREYKLSATLNSFAVRIAQLEEQTAAPCEGVNELRDQIEDVACRAEMRFKSFDDVWQALARSVSALTSKVESK